MAIRNILTEGNETLRKVSRPVTEINHKIELLVEDLFDTMRKAEGVGLAAPQVGILKRVAVVEVENQTFVLINPVLTKVKGEQLSEEGCLSVPKVFGKVRRPKKVWVEAQDLNGDTYEIQATGLIAVALCHEIDHLDGKLFRDFVVEYTKEKPVRKKG